MSAFFKFKPVDTLYFRGAEPMSMGEDHISSSVFPPPSHTISGALRTAYLKEHDIDFSDYGNGNVENKIHGDIGEAGEDSPFSVIGPFFLKNNNFYIPAPFNWYIKKPDEKNKNNKNKDNKFMIIKSKKIETPLINSSRKIYWAKGEGELVSIGSKWIKVIDLYSDKNETELLNIDEFANFETRTGIALEENKRTVKERHLYSFKHARLKDDVEIIFGIDKEIDLANEGILKLGAEQRFGRYQKIENPFNEKSDEGNFLSLSLLEGTKEAEESLIATGKIHYIGGWDMKKGFHKDLKGYYPAGTVFNKKINDNLIKF